MATLKCLFKCLGRSLAVIFLVLLLVYLAVAMIYGLWLTAQGGNFFECMLLGLTWPAMALMIWVMAKAG